MAVTTEADLRASAPLPRLVSAFGYHPTLWPALVDHMRRLDRPIKVWSAGCYNGCETYTLAMHVLDAGLTGVRIVASDAFADRVTYSQRALYLTDEVDMDVKMGRLSPEMRARYFRPAGRDLVQVVDEVRALVEWHRPEYVPQHVQAADVAMLRNVWVHMNGPERSTLVDKLARKLPPDGLVVFRHLYPAEVVRLFPRRDHPLIYGRPRRGAGRRVRQWQPEVPHAAGPAWRSRSGRAPVEPEAT